MTFASCEPTLEQPVERLITLELEEEAAARLEREHLRLSREANPALPWDRFLQACVTIGLDRLRGIPAEDVLNLVGVLENGQVRLFHEIILALTDEPRASGGASH